MTIKKLLVFGLLLLMPAVAVANSDGRVYTIKKGDTLWGISERFIKDPYYWPNLWSNNPFITNPHLIYPGQKLMIDDGRIKIVGKQAPQPEPAVTPVPEQPAAVEAPMVAEQPEPAEEITIKTLGGAEGFVAKDELQQAGKIVDTTDNRIMMAEGDTVFCDMNNLGDVRPGDSFNLIEVGKEIKHPVTGTVLGNQVATLGTLIILGVNDEVATAKITSSFREIRRGSLLIPFDPPALEVVLKQADKQLNGYVIAAKEGKISIGQNDLIYVDLGEKEGLESGNLLYLTRTRKPSHLVREQTDLKLPDLLLGSAVVLETKEHTASALVLKVIEAVYRGDSVQTVTE